MKKVGILGCGWLGIPLAEQLVEKGFMVSGTRRSEAGLALLKNHGILPYSFELKNDSVKGDLDFFKSLECLIISLPPRDSGDPQLHFEKRMESLLQLVLSSKIKNVIFLSSTAVYGKKAGVWTEDSRCVPETAAGQALLYSEALFLNSSVTTLVVRLGGLIGENRNPIHPLSGKSTTHPKSTINFIHQKDAVQGILSLLLQKNTSDIYNLVSPDHPERKTYYEFMAQKKELPPPIFVGNEGIHRIIKAEKIIRDTNFQYTVNNLLI